MAYQEAQAAARAEEGLEPTEEPSSSVQRRYKSLRGAPSEHEPLLTRAASKRSISKTMRRRRSSAGPHGDATVTQAVLMVFLLFFTHQSKFSYMNLSASQSFRRHWHSIPRQSVRHQNTTSYYLDQADFRF